MSVEWEVLLGGAARPGASESIGDRFKLHRYLLRLDRREYTIITPRPGTGTRFSTNRYHGTWHVLSDLRGARQLRHRLPLGMPAGTVRWHTPGLAPAVTAWRCERDRPPGQRLWYPPPGARHHIDRVGGVLVLAAMTRELKSWAVAVAQLGDWLQHGMDYTDLNGTSGESRSSPTTSVAWRPLRRRAAKSSPARPAS